MQRYRVLYVLKNFPQMSETYIKTEIEAVKQHCDIKIVSTKTANLPAQKHEPYEQVYTASQQGNVGWPLSG